MTVFDLIQYKATGEATLSLKMRQKLIDSQSSYTRNKHMYV